MTRIVLGIESAIAGGSISLWSDGSEIAGWMGTDKISKAEKLLPNIDVLLRENLLQIKDVDLMAVATGPGSYTGIRVGIATVLGLRAAHCTRCVGVGALEALAYLSNSDEVVISALPMGRGVVCWQQFANGQHANHPQLTDLADFIQLVRKDDQTTFVLHGTLFRAVSAVIPEGRRSIDAGENIASHICNAARSSSDSEAIRPLFVERER